MCAENVIFLCDCHCALLVRVQMDFFAVVRTELLQV